METKIRTDFNVRHTVLAVRQPLYMSITPMLLGILMSNHIKSYISEFILVERVMSLLYACNPFEFDCFSDYLHAMNEYLRCSEREDGIIFFSR